MSRHRTSNTSAFTDEPYIKWRQTNIQSFYPKNVQNSTTQENLAAFDKYLKKKHARHIT